MKDHRESEIPRREEILDAWQRKWNESNKCRETVQYLQDVRTVIEIKWETDHCVIQFVLERGNIKANLRKINLVEDANCYNAFLRQKKLRGMC